MGTVDVAVQSPDWEKALGQSVKALRRLADTKLDPALQQRQRDLGERKEFLTQREHEELMALVAFGERRTIERLEAEVALKQLGDLLPGLTAS